jgi:NinB protein
MRAFTLNPASRPRALEFIAQCPDGLVVTVKEPTRSLEQNARLWACLHDVAAQVIWHGQRLTAEDWKHVFTAALRKTKVVPGLDGGFVVCGMSTSKMGKAQFAELIELIHAFGAERGVMWSDTGDFRSAA